MESLDALRKFTSQHTRLLEQVLYPQVQFRVADACQNVLAQRGDYVVPNSSVFAMGQKGRDEGFNTADKGLLPARFTQIFQQNIPGFRARIFKGRSKGRIGRHFSRIKQLADGGIAFIFKLAGAGDFRLLNDDSFHAIGQAAARPTNNHLSGHDHTLRDTLPIDALHQQFDSAFAHLMKRLPDSGQWHAHGARFGDVIEPDQRNLAWHGNSAHLQSFEGADGHAVVGRDNGIDLYLALV